MRNIYQTISDNRPTTQFDSSEEAWFWFCLCEELGSERAKGGESKKPRPCETSDILLAVKRLHQNGKLNLMHLKVMQKYGKEQAPPHCHFGATERICSLWKEAMNILETLLRQKGIVSGT